MGNGGDVGDVGIGGGVSAETVEIGSWLGVEIGSIEDGVESAGVSLAILVPDASAGVKESGHVLSGCWPISAGGKVWLGGVTGAGEVLSWIGDGETESSAI